MEHLSVLLRDWVQLDLEEASRRIVHRMTHRLGHDMGHHW